MSASQAATKSHFEGSYLGAADRISPRAVMECKICWSVYDPENGDEARQILPGTPFLALPEDWKCPACDGAKEQFMVLRDPGAADLAAERDVEGDDDPQVKDRIDEQAKRLAEEFTDVWRGKMRDVPFLNKALEVETVGFRPWRGRGIGVLITPWFMNLVVVPRPSDDWSDLKVGEKERIAFPSGEYEFLHMTAGLAGGVKRCSLFSPMNDFKSQAEARAVAEQIVPALFDEENREATDRAGEIRAAREADLAEQAKAPEVAEKVVPPTGPRKAKPLGRRDFLTSWRSPSAAKTDETREAAG